jgi:septum formation protein
LLQAAGFDVEVRVSGVAENDTGVCTTREIVLVLAERKARAVVASLTDALVLGCDSLLELDGQPRGKPSSAADAIDRWRSMRGRSGRLVTGHCLIDASSGAAVIDAASTLVRFGTPSDAEIDAYVATGEPLAVAGAFTLDGIGAPFVDGVDGDPSNVIGLSLPLLRRMLERLGRSVVDLWR